MGHVKSGLTTSLIPELDLIDCMIRGEVEFPEVEQGVRGVTVERGRSD